MRKTVRRSIIDQIDQIQNESVEILRSMVRIESFNPPGRYDQIAQFVHDTLAAEAFEVEIIDVPQEILDRYRLPTPRYNVLATLYGRQPRPAVYLNAHLDTVPAECVPGDLEKWTVPPFAGIVKDGRVYGRGACDSKGRLTSYMTAAIALKRAGVAMNGSVVIAATADEETSLSPHTGAGYLGTLGKLQGDYAIVEGMSYEINYTNPGSLGLRILTYGDSLHTSQVQASGVNAIHTMNLVVSELLAYQEELKRQKSAVPNMGHTVINVGLIRGGLDDNMTASSCTVEVAIVPIPEHSLELLESTIRQRLDAAKARHPELQYACEVYASVAPVVSSSTSPLIEALRRNASEVLHESLDVNGLTGRTDMLFFVEAGMQTVNYGPGRLFESNLHLPDENVRIADLIGTSKVIALSIAELLGAN
jgi:succinyl-diaminopimelate desuccinylase